jgi:transglutaminase-like putative cysteine protease
MTAETAPTTANGSPFIAPGGRHEYTRAERETRAFPFAPAEGWLTILFVFLIVLPISWSIQDSRWVLGRRELTEFLPWAALGGTAWGILGAKVGWSRWRTHLLGAVVAGLVVPILVGTVLEPNGGIAGWFLATSTATVEAGLDLLVRGKSVTQQYGHFLLVFGVLVWGTGQFAAYAALGHRRPLGAIFVTGLVLLANMSVTFQEQLPFLVIYTIAALCLLVRLHADEERVGWLRRRIGDPSIVTGLYLRGGGAFVAAAVIGSLFLTNVAASAPLAGAFQGLDQKLVDFGQSIQRYLPFGGPGTRISGGSFGPTTSIAGRWVTDQTPALQIRRSPTDQTPLYWRAYAYDRFTGTGWSVSESSHVNRPANSPILADTGDSLQDPAVRHDLPFTVDRLSGYSGSAIFTPDAPDSIGIDARLTLVGTDGEFGALESSGGWSTYTAKALIPTVKGDEGFTINKLEAAGTDYPDDIEATYTQVPAGALGPNANRLLERIRAKAGSSNPYDMAAAARDLLRSDEFTYSTDVTALDCNGLSTVECFATWKQGYCEYYATTMAILLRQAGIPTRLAEGYLPGGLDPRTGIETILRSNSHAWVEVYFPKYGWYTFDPTGGGLTTVQPLPTGRPVPSPSASARPSGSDDNGPDPRRTIRPAPGGGTIQGTSPGPGSGAYIALAVLLAVAIGGIGFLAYRRGPRDVNQPDAIWAAVGSLAGRFGWAPRATQTPYEYAVALGEVLPMARPELQTVASAKVEVAYGRRILDDGRIAALRDAHRRLRVLLLRLAFRRPKRTSTRLRR